MVNTKSYPSLGRNICLDKQPSPLAHRSRRVVGNPDTTSGTLTKQDDAKMKQALFEKCFSNKARFHTYADFDLVFT